MATATGTSVNMKNRTKNGAKNIYPVTFLWTADLLILS